MKASSLKLLLSWQALQLATLCAASSQHTTVVLIAFDGIPQKYLDNGTMSFLKGLAADATTTEWMMHQLPPQSLPNLQSIATGLYPEDHGVIGDHILVDGSDQCQGYGPTMYTRKTNVTPLWTLNELTGGGRYSGVVAWPGFEFIHQNATSPTFQIKANDCKSWKERVDLVMQWLTNGTTPANLIFMHFEYNQTQSAESIPKILAQIDETMKYYFDKLNSQGIREKVNTIIVSDHTYLDHSVDVMPQCRKNIVSDNSSCHAQIWKSLAETSKQLNAFKATQYAKLKSNFQTTGGISSEAEQYLNAQHIKIFVNPREFLRSLGQEEQNEGMFPLFIADGPLFEPKFKAAPFENVDIYALISETLELTKPSKPINGTFASIKFVLLKEKPVYEDKTFKWILYIIVVLLLLACGWYILRIRKQERIRF